MTGDNVDRRIAGVSLDAAFLMMDVEVVAAYEFFNINRTKLENVLHRFFENSTLDIQINDRFGNPVIPGSGFWCHCLSLMRW